MYTPTPASNAQLTGRGARSVNVLLAMLITVTVFFQVIEQRFLCYRLKYIRNCFIFFNPVYNIIKGVLFVGNEFKDTVVKTYPPIDPIVTPLILITFISVTFSNHERNVSYARYG